MILLCLSCWQHTQSQFSFLFFLFSFQHSLIASGCILMAISNAWTLRRYIDSELKACIMVSCDVFCTYKWIFELGWSHLRHVQTVCDHTGCIFLALIFIWMDILYILVFALSLFVESGHLYSLASLSIVARVRPTFYKMTAFMVQGKRWMAIFWWLRFSTLDLSILARDRLKDFQ